MSCRRAIVTILLGSLTAGCTSNSSLAPTPTGTRTRSPDALVTVSPALGVTACEPGAVSRFLPPSPHDQDLLTGVAAFSGRDVWAVGEQFNGRSSDPGGQLTLIEHWDGRRWRVVPSPNQDDGSIQGVSAISSNDVWAVGASYVGFSEVSSARALVEHWDGKAWTRVPGPNTDGLGAYSGIIGTVATIGPRDIWISWDNHVFRWDGRAWTELHPAGRVLPLADRGPRGVWAGGTALSNWDGKRWTRIAMKPGLPKGSAFNAVALSPSRDVWTVGGLGYAMGHQHPFAIRVCAG
jgi:hypothetical protein